MKQPFRVIHGYELKAYKKVSEYKRDLTRPYWSYERYRCIEDAFLIYLQEEETKPYPTIKDSGLAIKTLADKIKLLRERHASIVWYYPNYQPAYPLFQDLIQYTIDTVTHPFNRGSRSVIYDTIPPPPFYTIKSFRKTFPDAILYPPANTPIEMYNHYNKEKKRKLFEMKAGVTVEELKEIVPLTPSECYISHHPLWDKEDPPENTASFMIKFFGYRTYDQVQQYQPEFAAGRIYANRYLKG